MLRPNLTAFCLKSQEILTLLETPLGGKPLVQKLALTALIRRSYTQAMTTLGTATL